MARIGELEVGQDLKFEKRWWIIERCGWGVIAAILISAVLGYFGPGPLTRRIAGERGGALWLEYNRFQRYHAPVEWRIHFNSKVADKDEIRLWIDRNFIQAVNVKHIEPQPEAVDIDGERFVYHFNARPLSGTAKILIHFEPNKFGSTPVRLGILNGPEVQFGQFYYP